VAGWADLTTACRARYALGVSGSHVQRAELLADLGRYAEAAAELADAGANDVPAQTLLARVKLAEGARQEALAAADAAVAADPTDLGALIARGMVLADLGHADEAVAQAEEILRQGRGNGYACTSAAAILSEVRNGQVALDAAWEGVRLTPEQSRAHLVLGVVAARLGMDDIAQRAYREALSIDPNLSVARAALGVARVEQHRYVQALSHLADREPPAASAPPTLPPSRLPQSRPPAPRSYEESPQRPRQGPDPSEVPRSGDLRRLLHVGALYALAAPLMAAWAFGVGIGASVVSVLLAAFGLVGLAMGRNRLAGAVRSELPGGPRTSPAVVTAMTGAAFAPPMLLLAAAVGYAWPLAIAVAGGMLSLIAAHRLPSS
jgi:tetratricopeptide (TPR) repeat protein